jgi:hypothetical protein
MPSVKETRFLAGTSATTLRRREDEYPPNVLDRISRLNPDETEHKKILFAN